VIEPIFECDFAESSYGFRPGRGCKDALRHVNKLLEQGKLYVVDADIKAYFDSIPHSKLLDLIRSRIADGQMLDLIRVYLTQGVKDGDTEWTPSAGTPQGAVLSPLLANIYLNGLDHLLTDEGFEVVRYADDFVIMCMTEGSARAALDLVKQWTTEHGLTLHPDKTRIAHAVTDGFEFLGYFFRGTKRWPRKKSQQQLKHAVRGITPRTHGQSMSRIIARLNPVLRGWYEYFKHSGPGPLLRMDQWVRMRLRSVLRKRQRGRGIGRGSDHQRWPNAYFAEQGLFSLATAHARDRQSARR
jgi:RNA-directed DNA polymerase